jgi:hypothetical protein
MTHLLRKPALLIPAAIVGVLAAFFLWQTDFLFTPQVSRVTPAGLKDVGLDATIGIDFSRFSRPVDRQLLQATITPDIEGEWHYDNPVWDKHLSRRLVFAPTRTLTPETSYTVTLREIQSAFHLGETRTYQFTFSTPALPDVDRVSPEDGAPLVSPETGWTIALDRPNPGYAEFDFLIEPETDVTVERSCTGMNPSKSPRGRSLPCRRPKRRTCSPPAIRC